MRRHSPLTYAANIKTPTLILHAREDRRCPLPMGRAFHQALRVRGVPTQMVIYPGEGHGIRRPRHREDVLRRTLAWFEQHSRPDGRFGLDVQAGGRAAGGRLTQRPPGRARSDRDYRWHWHLAYRSHP